MVTIENVMKSVLKVGLKAALPFVGDIVVTAVEEGVGLLLDHSTQQKARDLHARILKEMQKRAKAQISTKKHPPDRLANILPIVERLLNEHRLTKAELLDVHFDAEQAANIILHRAVKVLDELNEEDKTLCASLVEIFYTALMEDPEALINSESLFRSAVLNRIDRLPEEMAKYTASQTEAALRLATDSLVQIPYRRWRPERSPPGALLRPDNDRPVPFHGRKKEMASLEAWCHDEATIGIRLFTGPGGMGKTRLLIQLCKEMHNHKWQTGFLAHQAVNAPAVIWPLIIHQSTPLLLVVDYAETRRKELNFLFREVYKADEGRIRIVLLARAAGDWWDSIKTEREGVGELLSGPATLSCELEPLAMTVEDRENSYWKAAETFSGILKKPLPAGIPGDLEAKYFKQVLLLHMTALAAIDGIEVKGEQGILDYVLNRERGFWAERAEARSLPKTIERGVGQGMAAITLGGGVKDEAEALSVLAKIPLLRDKDRDIMASVGRLLHDTYPGDKWIEPILPDLLGEHLVQVELEDEPDALLDLVLGKRDAK